MRVILLEEVENLGKPGDVVDVKAGYARNYLIPRGLGKPATAGALKQIDQIRRAAEKRLARERSHAESIVSVLKETVIEFRVRAGSRNRLYGSVTSSDIAEAIKEKTGIEIDRRSLVMDRPIRQLGEYVVPVRLMAGVTGEVQVRVLNEHGEIPEIPEWEEAEEGEAVATAEVESASEEAETSSETAETSQTQ